MRAMVKTLVTMGLATVGLAACSGKEDDSGADGASATDAELWEAMDGYSSWSQVAPWEGVAASGAAHGAFVQIWVNDTGVAAAEAGGTDFPEGTILVKESYDAEDGAATGVTAMWKGAGTDETGGWHFVKYSTSGDVEVAGADGVSACGGCHSAGPDYSLAWSEG